MSIGAPSKRVQLRFRLAKPEGPLRIEILIDGSSESSKLAVLKDHPASKDGVEPNAIFVGQPASTLKELLSHKKKSLRDARTRTKLGLAYAAIAVLQRTNQAEPFLSLDKLRTLREWKKLKGQRVNAGTALRLLGTPGESRSPLVEVLEGQKYRFVDGVLSDDALADRRADGTVAAEEEITAAERLARFLFSEGQGQGATIPQRVRAAPSEEAAEFSPVFLDHSLPGIRAKNRYGLGCRLDELRSEESQWPTSPLGARTLLFGPPYIGKTCYAFRRASRTNLVDGTAEHILWFNALHDNPGDLLTLDDDVSPDCAIALVIDDIHGARNDLASWTGPVQHFVGRRPDRVRLLWIARDESLAQSLRVDPIELDVTPFPIDQVTDVFLKRLDAITVDKRVIAALDTGLDPAMGRAMKSWDFDTKLTYEALVERIRAEHGDQSKRALARMKEELGDAYTAYLALLPFGALARGADAGFLSVLAKSGASDLDKLERHGVATCSRDGRFVWLTEHPFQIRRTLFFLDDTQAEAEGVRLLSGYLATTASPPHTLSDAVLHRFVEASPAPREALAMLQTHAEWAGILEPVASVARHLAEASNDPVLKEDAHDRAMKLFRMAYPRDDDKEYAKRLEEDLLWWEAQRETASAAKGEISSERRLDWILYEIAYIHYLMGRYSMAADAFRDSVRAAVRAVDRALGPGRTADVVVRARGALSNIWISALMERRATMRDQLLRVFTGELYDERRAVEVTQEVIRIYRALDGALAKGPEAAWKAGPFIEAVRAAVMPTHEFAQIDDANDFGVVEQRVRQHCFNTWLSAMDMSSWPWLFNTASSMGTVEDVPEPDHATFGRLAPTSGRDSRIGFHYRRVELLHRAASHKKEVSLSEALHVAAMLRAGGDHECVGDHLLLAWRIARTPEEKGAIGWFLANRVPRMTFDTLPLLALGKLENEMEAAGAPTRG